LTTHTIYEITGSGYGSETLRAHLIYMRGVSLGPEDKAVTETQPPAIEQIKYEMAPPGFSGVVHKMKDKGLTTEQAFTLAWSMYKKGHKAHVAPEGFVRRNRGMQCSECHFRTYSTTEADKHRRTVHLHLQESVKQADLDFLKSFDHNFEGMGPQLFLLPIAKVHGYEPLALATSVGESTRYSFVKHSTRPKDYLQLELKSDSKSYGTVAGWVRYSNGFANATRGRSVEELNRHLLESESPFLPSIAVGASEHPLPAQQPLKTDPSHSLPPKVAPVGPVLPDHPKHEDDMGMMTYDQPQANQADDDEQTPQDMDATDSDEAVGHPYYHGGNLSCPDCGAPYEVILSSTKDLECTQCHTKTPLSEMSPYRLIHHLDILSHHGFTPIASKHTSGKTTNSVYKNKDRHFIVVNPHNGSWAHHAGDRKVFGSRLPNLDQHLSRHYGNNKFVEAAQPNMWAVKNKDAKKRHKLFAILAALHGNSGKYSLEDVNKALNAEGLPAIARDGWYGRNEGAFTPGAPVGGSAFTGRQMKQQMDADDDDHEGDTEPHMRFRRGHSPHQKHLHWMFSDDESVNEATEYKGGYKGIVRELPEPPNSRPNHKGSEWMGRIPLIHGYRQHTQANEAGAPMKFTHQTTDHVLTISRSMSDEGAREGRGWKIEHRGRMLNQGRGAAEMHSALRKIHTPHAKEARDLIIPANQHVDRKKRLLDRVKERKLRRVVGSKSTTESLDEGVPAHHQRMMDEFHAAKDPRVRAELKSVSAPDRVRIGYMEVPHEHQGKGLASHTMKLMTHLADKHKVPMELTASSRGDKGDLEQDHLYHMYGKHGFVRQPDHSGVHSFHGEELGSTMVREPKAHTESFFESHPVKREIEAAGFTLHKDQALGFHDDDRDYTYTHPSGSQLNVTHRPTAPHGHPFSWAYHGKNAGSSNAGTNQKTLKMHLARIQKYGESLNEASRYQGMEVKRGPHFSDSYHGEAGEYHVHINGEHKHTMFREPSNGWWHESVPGKHFSQTVLGFNRKEAEDTLAKKHNLAKHESFEEDFTPEDPSMAREHLKKHGWHEVPGTRSNNSQSSFHVHADPKYSEHHFKVHPDGSWEHHKGSADGGGKIHDFKLKGKGHSAEQLHNYLSGGAKKPAAAAPPEPKAHIPAPGPAKRPTPPAASPKASVAKPPAHRGVDKYGDGEIARNLRAKLGLQHGKKKKYWWEEVDADSDDQDPGAGGGANGEPNINQINKNLRDGTADAIQGKTDTVEPDEPLKPSRSGPNHKNAQ
jgi:hypothetical protein